MAEQEQFRNAQGGRLMVRLAWMPLRTQAFLVRVARLVGVAPVLWAEFGRSQ